MYNRANVDFALGKFRKPEAPVRKPAKPARSPGRMTLQKATDSERERM